MWGEAQQVIAISDHRSAQSLEFICPPSTIWKFVKGSFLAEKGEYMEFFNSAVGTLQTLVVALGAALCVWGGINLLEGYGQDNPGAKSQGVKHVTPN